MASISHTLFVVGEFGFYLHHIKVEILCAHGRSKGTDSLGGCTPEARNHVDGEGERGDAQEEGRHGGLALCFIIVGKLDKSEEIASQEGEEGNPKGKEGFAIEQTPTISQVGYGEELEGERQFQETEGHFDLVHPRTATARLLQEGGEEGEEGEGESQCNGETEHADGGSDGATARGADTYEEESDDGTGAREAHQSQGEGHEEDAQQTSGAGGLRVDGVVPLGREGNLKPA